MTLDALTLGLITTTFLLAGTVKGIIGLGLPSVSLGLLTATIDLTTAMALLIVPSLVTNIWQALYGQHTRLVFLRIWPFLLAATLTVWAGALALNVVNLPTLSTLLGVLLIVYALISLTGFRPALAPKTEVWAGPACGSLNGILTGMTGSFVVPGVMYLQSLNLPRDKFIQAMGMLFTLSTLALAVALEANKLVTVELRALSVMSVVPAIAGMFIGQRIRQTLSEARFRTVFYLAIIVLGSYILLTGVNNIVAME